jgi:Fe-S-cluster containining protein
MQDYSLKYLMEHIEDLPQTAKKSLQGIKPVLKRIKKKKPKDLDTFVHNLHEEYFQEVDCLSCGNCCKSLGPRITDRDIDRLVKHLRIKPSAFVEKYLRIDEDNDYVFKSMPCPFLDDDNYCMVYEYRPKACREYPHTNRPKFVQILDLSLKNCETCPVVCKILIDVQEKYK